MKKHLAFLALTTVLSIPLQADDLQYLTAACNSREKSIGLATVQKITFENGNVVVSTTGGPITFPIAEMKKLAFTSTATAIGDLKSQSKTLAYVDGALYVQGSGVLRVYSMTGNLQRLADIRGGAIVSLNNLPKGIYVIQLGNETIKIQK